jgi:SAM-dependent MidA family methyltransferase
MSLTEIISARILKEGPVSFRDFMEMALYYPGLGYYTSGGKKIGSEGDFYTSSSVSPAIGITIARQLSEMAQITNGNFAVVEYGAGNGTLCSDILGYFQKDPELFKRISYYIIEKSQQLKGVQKALLKDALLKDKVKWVQHISEVAPVTGCVLSNEMVDNLAVHVVEMKEELMEVFVDYHNGFREVLRPARKEILDYFEALKVTLPLNFRTEVGLDAINWIREVAAAIGRGFLFTIDYGYTSSEFYDPLRREGTLVGYYKHQVTHNLYWNPGEQDITAHVNFSALALFGHQNGLDFVGYRNQGTFLQALDFTSSLRQARVPGESYHARVNRENFVSHLLLDDMGKKFRVLIQCKNIPGTQLTGFKPLRL